ncbi:hypothetical protein Pmar_PMAR016611 [Perkinsus marinus ATCC 50983]|uniref:KHDC4/BBP-like KH-domain type I domain-containing protein n=1 Tax=Perkinsus marinus (strain ATCC 50983 / TXsc) TaxID=423536 RepID=C5KTN3_PERM5|nr:hypothetical protein Pmar_PMAR016611 [Perkinsus marinus ATCC 50983]EER12212.1 hypothetical protein Pmar_PMAR016611 [Perkinsus marinus ATCC 50983]|eukprot:XP_002780417.1 hypothetical protein Pmar_PMAR016611 [Perkinsus marinus ATCC 50983]
MVLVKILKGVQGVLRVVWGLYKSPSTFTSPTMTTINEQQPQLPANGTGDFVYGKGLEGAVVDSVARRIIGNKGSNMKRIVGLSNAKLRLRGQGSGYLEGTLRRESPDPLHLCISCVTREGYLAAVKETKTLLKRVYAEWRNFQIKRGRGDPGMIGIQMKEHFLTGPSSTIRGGGTQIFNTYSPRRFGSSSPVSEKKDLYSSRTTMRSKRH